MAELTVHFDLRFSARMLRWAMAGAMVLVAAPELASESVSLTTYYPAPSGVYTQLIATSNAFMARDTGYLDVGTNVTPPSPAGIGTVKEYVENGAVLLGSPNVLAFGNYSEIDGDQGGSIELGGNNSVAGVGTPYIDFHYAGLGGDFNTRIINDASNQLSIFGQGGAGSTGFSVNGRVGTNGYSPTTGYPSGWSGGIHTFDVYSEGSVGNGAGGTLLTYMSQGVSYAANKVLSAQAVESNVSCSEITFSPNSVATCAGYITTASGFYSMYMSLPIPQGPTGPTQTTTTNAITALCCSCPTAGGNCDI